MKKYQGFLSENFQFLEVKFSIYWNRRVYVMKRQIIDMIFIFMSQVYEQTRYWNLSKSMQLDKTNINFDTQENPTITKQGFPEAAH